jgi:hypothetical protein
MTVLLHRLLLHPGVLGGSAWQADVRVKMLASGGSREAAEM